MRLIYSCGLYTDVYGTINISSAQRFQVPPQRVPFHKRQEICRQVDEMLEAKIIELADSHGPLLWF